MGNQEGRRRPQGPLHGRYRNRRGRKRTAGTFPTERQAQRAWQRAERDQEVGRIGDPNRGKQSLRAYVEQRWFPNHRIEKTTRENYRYALDKYSSTISALNPGVNERRGRAASWPWSP
jgi:hypothetical protein